MKKQIRILAVIVFLLILSSTVYANNLSVRNVSLEDRNSDTDTAIVEFDLSWDNSWRNTTNYDAAWIVLKVQVGSTWVHGHLKDGGTNPSGTSVGSNKSLEINVPTDTHGATSRYLGAFVYRKSTGSGTVNSKDVRLKLDYATTASRGGVTIVDTTTITVKVVGIEMVYIPQESFYAGDVNTSTATLKTGSAESNPWYLDSEGTIRVTGGATGTFYYQSAGNTGEFASGTQFTIPAVFPKGYGDFYCMKYEATEALWLDFFNTLDSSSKTTRDITAASGKNSDSVVKRNTISWSSGDASGSRNDRVINYLSWMDLAALLDWAALRPMTELEMEKVARGGLVAVAGEYAWGDASVTAGVTFSGSPEDGNETFTTASANAVCNVTTFSQGDDFLGAQYVQGPVRPGIFATSSSTRATSGAGYYGVMELSGNVFERVVTIGNTTGISYYPWHGDGILSSLDSIGNARQIGWPGSAYYTGYIGVTGADGSGYKGGAWDRACTGGTLATSNRSFSALTQTTQNNYAGGRGVRSVSPPTLPTCGDNVLTPPETCDDNNTTEGDGCSSQCEIEQAAPAPGVN